MGVATFNCLFRTLDDVVEVLRKGVTDKEFYIIIRRSCILDDLLECMAKSRFSPSMKLNVCGTVHCNTDTSDLPNMYAPGQGHVALELVDAHQANCDYLCYNYVLYVTFQASIDCPNLLTSALLIYIVTSSHCD